MEKPRPDPDDLLARLNVQASKQNRGKLKVFFGFAAGVGKTYAMLEAARAAAKAGTDVVVGCVETHGRKDTEALLNGLETLPRQKVNYRGALLEEFDLVAALDRRPALLLVDELAHTNATGTRHVKRWQDVVDLVEAGINVYTTVNVQHLDSLNDLVAQVAGIQVRETIPDSVLDQADEIELIDLPVDELLRRMEEGKVYIPSQAERAMRNFFRPGNLIAMREMALRRAADRVDAQMQDYRRDHAIQATWPVNERLIVSVGPSPFSARLIRATKRLSIRLSAEWIAVFVETPDYASQPLEVRERVLAALRLAEQLGAETAVITGNKVSDALLQYARSRNVSKVVIGKPAGSLWKRVLKGTILDELIESGADLDIYVTSGEPGPPLPVGPARKTGSVSWREYAWAGAIVGVCTAVSLLFRATLAPTNLAMVYLLGVVAVARRYGRTVSFLASFASVAAFDVVCVPPYMTFAVADYEYLVTFTVMLTVALVISSMTIQIREQAARAVQREARTQALYRLSKELAGETRVFEVARAATAITREVLQSSVVIFLPDERGKITFRKRTTDELPVPSSEEGIAQWAYDHAQMAGKGTNTLPGATALYVPLKGSARVLGVMTILPENGGLVALPEQQYLLELFASQTALAMERTQAEAAARKAELRVEAEQMRSSLLSAVSHDLRTPLASITGAATSLLSKGDAFDPPTRRDLLETIAEEAQRLARLVNNLLEITRLESGAVEIRRDWCSLEEIVGAALNRTEAALEGRPVSTDLPLGLPLLSGDAVLLEEVFINLFENAGKYTPAGSPVEVSAAAWGEWVEVEVKDRGPGFKPGEETLIFDKFYRGVTTGTRGAGLGLAISKAIVKTHGGTIEAHNRPDGGAAMRVRLPISAQSSVLKLPSEVAEGE